LATPRRGSWRRIEAAPRGAHNVGLSAVLSDTLLLSQRLGQAGFSAGQAQGTAAALAETFGQIVTRDHLDMRLRELEQRTEQRLNALEQRTDQRCIVLEQRMTVKFGGMLAAAVALIAALIKLG